MKEALAAACCSLILGALPAFAHHSLGAYDRSISKTIAGTVKEYEFANPHVRLIVVVGNPDGSSTEWLFESGSVSRLVSYGFNRVSTWPGDEVTVTYNPRRSGSAGGYFLSFTNSKGRTYGPTTSRE